MELEWFQHLYLLGRSATSTGTGVRIHLLTVSTPLPSGKVCDQVPVNEMNCVQLFQHLYLLGRSATKQVEAARKWLELFQHLYLLGRSATD